MPTLLTLSPVTQALLATVMTCLITTLGALCVFGFRRGHALLLDAMLAGGAGVMLASSFFSLLEPGLEMARAQGQCAWLVGCAGFLVGGVALLLGEGLFAHLTRCRGCTEVQRRDRLLVASITLHNIPEGLAIGVAFGAATAGDAGLCRAAWMLAVGIGLQNFPEGAAVSLPLHRDGMPRARACFWGFVSALVEPLAGLAGVLLASSARALLPLMLCFAAGAMILVVIAELVPESQRSRAPRRMALATLLGFAIMMALDVALG